MKIALIQQDIEFGNPEKNIEKALYLVRQAVALERAAAPATTTGPPLDLVVLPEFLQGSPHQPHPPHFVDTDAAVLARFQALARELDVCIVPGTISHYEPAPTAVEGETVLFNTAYFVQRDGSVAGEYHKKNLWHSERPKYAKGPEPHAVFDTEFGKTGMLICWDVMWPEAFKQLAAQDVDLIVIPSYWTGYDNVLEDDDNVPAAQPSDADEGDAAAAPADSESVFLRSALVTRAFESGALVVYTNVGGATSKGFIGLSQVCLPMWGALPAARVYDVSGLDAVPTQALAAAAAGTSGSLSSVTIALAQNANSSTGPAVPGILDTSDAAIDRIQIVQIGGGSAEGESAPYREVKKRLAHAERVYKIRKDAKSENWHY